MVNLPIMANKQQKKLYEKIALLGCSLCRHQGNEGTPAELHHIRRGGVRSRSPVIPLCHFHHRGANTSIHSGRKWFESHYGITEEQLLAQTESLINE
jgi:hypothetical protein